MTVFKNLKRDIEGLERLGETTGPVLVFSLIKFLDEADYSNHPEEEACTGREAYLKYFDILDPTMREYKVKLIFRGAVKHVLTGEMNEDWDVIAIVEWDKISSLKDFMERPEVLENRYHFEAALANYRQYVTERL